MVASKQPKADRGAGSKRQERLLGRKPYREELRFLQIELVKLQRHLIDRGERVLILFEGRDGSGKDGVIKRLTAHASPRETRIVALGKPTERDRNSWYFQRYVPHLPASQELVLFNRSWYNRAGVEPVMGFCTEADYEAFMESVVPFEMMLVKSGIRLCKYYLDISRDEQKRRLERRRSDPLATWKTSPIDRVAVARWKDYSRYRNRMLERTHTPLTPWHVVATDDKRRARMNVLRAILSSFSYPGAHPDRPVPEGDILFAYDRAWLDSGRIAP